MSRTEQNGRYHDGGPNRESGSSECGHRESAVQKLFAAPRGDRQSRKGQSLRRRLRKDSSGHRLDSRWQFVEQAPHATEIHPVKRREKDRSDDACDNRTKQVRTSTKPQFWPRISMHPGAPPRDAHRDPLEQNRREVKRNAFTRFDARLREKLLQTNAPAPRNNHRKNQKDEPNVPRHLGMKSRLRKAKQLSRAEIGGTWRHAAASPRILYNGCKSDERMRRGVGTKFCRRCCQQLCRLHHRNLHRWRKPQAALRN